MKTNTTPSTRTWAPAPLASNLRLKSLGLAFLTSLTLLAPVASAAVTIIEDEINSGACVLRSGGWSLSEDEGVFIPGLLFVGGEPVGAFSLDVFHTFDSSLRVISAVSDGGSLVLSVDVFPSDQSTFSQATVSGRFSLFVNGSFSAGDSLGDDEGDDLLRGGVWSGSYQVVAECEPPAGVPEGGGSLALFACGLGAVGAGRRFINKRRV